MDAKEIQNILDNLDRRIALGEIDLGTYQTLKAKFGAQITDEGANNPLGNVVSSLPREARAIKCPGCMAPLPTAPDPLQTSIVCTYCGGSFALQTAADEMARLQNSLRKWVAEVAGGITTSGTVDEASRSFIFENKIIGTLTIATNRATELFGMVRYQPLFTLPLLDILPSSPFQQALQMTPDVNYLVNQVKETVARVQSNEIKSFAVSDKQKGNLQALEVRCLETIYLSHVRKHSATFSTDGLKTARTNLQALDSLYATSSKLLLPSDHSLGQFFAALSTRVKAVDKAIETLSYLITNPEGVMVDSIVAKLDAAAMDCDKAVADIESAGRDPKETVPASEGTSSDAWTIRIFSTCLRLFGECGAETGEAFANFMDALKQAVNRTKSPSSDLQWLSSFLSNLFLYFKTINGDAAVAVVGDYGWIEGVMTVQVRSSLFGGKEMAEAEKKMLIPFWVGELDFSQQKGLIFKKGQAVQGLLFMEATHHESQCFVVSADDPFCAQCQAALKAPRPIGRSVPAVILVSSPENAQKTAKRFISVAEGYAGGYIKSLSLIYLPVAVARYYTKKSERREMLLPCSKIKIPACNPGSLRLGTKELVLMN